MKNNGIQERFESLYHDLLINNTLPFAGSLLERAARLWPHRTALTHEDTTLTFQKLHEQSCQISNLLQKKGIKAGDRVIIVWENSLEFYTLYYGAWQTGAVVVPLNTFLHATELSYIFNHAQPHFIISSMAFQMLGDEKGSYTFITQEELQEARSLSTIYPVAQRGPHEMAILLYTSGTTGFPKGVMLSSENILINCLQGIACFSLNEQERLYAALPLFHSYMQNTCVWSPLIIGACVIIVSKIERKQLLRALEHKPTVILGIPALYGLFCLMKNACFDSVKYFICGGDVLTDKTRYYFSLLYRRKICNGYGLTETSPFIAVNLADAYAPASDVGVPLQGIEIEIRDEKGNRVREGMIGTIWVKGKNVMLGYYNNPELTANVIKNGWFNTADMGFIDDQSALVLAGRESDLIKNKGMKIYPQEIENVIMLYPHVMQVAVIGVQEGEEEVPLAFIALNHENPAIIEELKALCRNHIAPYKIPRRFIIKEKLPTTATGKVDKKALKREYHEKNTHSSSYFKP